MPSFRAKFDPPDLKRNMASVISHCVFFPLQNALRQTLKEMMTDKKFWSEYMQERQQDEQAAQEQQRKEQGQA